MTRARPLVLTGHPATWVPIHANETPPAYLGPWCFAFNEFASFRDLDRHEILVGPIKTSDEMLAAKNYIDDLCERLMPALAGVLNRMHGLDKNEKFWRKISLFWLMHWSGLIYDRYLRLREAEANARGRHPWSVKLPRIRSRGSFETYGQMMAQIDRHPINLAFFTDLLRHGNFTGFEIENIDFELDLTDPNIAPVVSTRGLKRRMGDWVREQQKKSEVRIGNIQGLRPEEKLIQTLKIDPLSIFRKQPSVIQHSPNHDASVDLEPAFQPKNEFERILVRIFPLWFPKFLRIRYEFSAIRGRAFVGNDISLSPVQAWEIAEICDRGGQWIGTQHGAGYGQLKAFPVGKVEYGESDKFLSWGWQFQHNYSGRIQGFPSIHLSKLPKKNQSQGSDHWLFLSSCHPTYHYRFHSALMPEQIPGFQAARLQFLKSLRPELVQSLRLKLYYNEFGTDERKRVIEALPNVRFADQSITSIGPQALLNSQFAVVDHFGTSLAEAMAANVPMLSFWDPEVFPAVDEIMPLLNAMKREKLLFDRPEDLASHLNEYAQEIPSWWKSEVIQKIRNEYVAEHALFATDWKPRWTAYLRQCRKIR